jgi:rhodanese-related sulfurtransferase
LAPSITVAELRNKPLSQLQLIDVRSSSEFASGHIPGAVNIPMDQIEARLQDLCPGLPLVLICQAGTRARMTADLLANTPHDIVVLEGGTSAWIQNGLPTVCCIRSRWSLERQVRLIAGVLALAGALLALTVNAKWVFLSAFIGLGLTFAGLTDICAMGMLLAKMPWNRTPHCIPAIHVSESSDAH